MSYVRPPASAVTASWQGEAVYSRPSANAAAGQWFVVYAASAVPPAAFGTPAYSAGLLPGEVASINATVFGTPVGSAHVAASVPTSLFGVAGEGSLRASPVPAAAFGVVSGQSLLRTSRVSRGAVFGTPLALFVDRVCVVSGFASNIGTPYGGIFTEPSYGTVMKASSAARSTFGQPSSPVQQICAASSVTASRFGAHRKGASPLSAFGTHAAVFVYPAAGFALSVFGTHEAASGHEAVSASAAQFGAPGVSREQAVAATNRTRFGTPTADMTGTHKTYGFRRSWFGNHRSLRDISKVSGWQSSGFGAPASYEIHRALHIPPEHRFGTHIMKRVV